MRSSNDSSHKAGFDAFHILVACLLASLLTIGIVKGMNAYNKVEQSPEAAASIRREHVLKEFEAWKTDTKVVVATAMESEKAKLKALAKVFVTPDPSQPLKAQFEERATLLARIKKDLASVYSGEAMDFEKIKGDYVSLLLNMKDPILRGAVLDCIEPMQTIYLQLHKADNFVDMQAQVSAYKAEVKVQAQKAISEEFSF